MVEIRNKYIGFGMSDLQLYKNAISMTRDLEIVSESDARKHLGLIEEAEEYRRWKAGHQVCEEL